MAQPLPPRCARCGHGIPPFAPVCQRCGAPTVGAGGALFGPTGYGMPAPPTVRPPDAEIALQRIAARTEVHGEGAFRQSTRASDGALVIGDPAVLILSSTHVEGMVRVARAEVRSLQVVPTADRYALVLGTADDRAVIALGPELVLDAVAQRLAFELGLPTHPRVMAMVPPQRASHWVRAGRRGRQRFRPPRSDLATGTGLTAITLVPLVALLGWPIAGVGFIGAAVATAAAITFRGRAVAMVTDHALVVRRPAATIELRTILRFTIAPEFIPTVHAVCTDGRAIEVYGHRDRTRVEALAVALEQELASWRLTRQAEQLMR